MKRSLVLLVSVIAWLAMPVLTRSQDATGRIIGTITDPSGAVVPDVQITVTNTATQDIRKAVTNQDGYFQILALPIGTYKLTAEHPGFLTVVSDEHKLLINQALRIDVKLAVG